MQITEAGWSPVSEPIKRRLEWTCEEYGTSRLTLPGRDGPLWTPCVRRVTQDLNAGQIFEDRRADEIKGKERRRQFKGDPRNIPSAFTYEAVGEASPRQWRCSECGHAGWLKIPGAREACGKHSADQPIRVVHHRGFGEAQAWDDAAGNELGPKITLKARLDEMEQFKRRGVYQEVKE